MDISTQKLQLIQQIVTIQDATLIQKIIELLNQFSSLNLSGNEFSEITIAPTVTKYAPQQALQQFRQLRAGSRAKKVLTMDEAINTDNRGGNKQ